MSIRNDPGLAIDLCRSEKEKMLAPKDLNGFFKKKRTICHHLMWKNADYSITICSTIKMKLFLII